MTNKNRKRSTDTLILLSPKLKQTNGYFEAYAHNIHTIKPLDEEIVIQAAKECGKVITAEEHSVIGGLGEAVCAVLSEKCPTPVRRVGVQDKFGCSGPAWDLLKLYGLDAATICKTAHEML